MKYKNIFKLIFKNFPKNCDQSTLLGDLNFDSMAQILLVSELNDKYDLIIDPIELGELVYISDLISFLDKYLDK